MVDQGKGAMAVRLVFKMATYMSEKRYKAGTKELTLALLKPAISQIATNSATEKIIDELGEHYANAHYFLLQQACEDYDDASLAEEEAKKASMERAKMILRFVVNACSRSRSFREGLPSNCIGFYRVLLRMRSFEHEVYALLATNAASINKAFAGSREYTTFLGEVCQIFFEAPDPQKGFFFNFFGLLIQDDFAFLANCYAEMEPSVFADLLAICETLTDREISRLRTRMHPNNVEFCVALLQRILSDMGEGKVSELQKKSLVPTLFYTVEILGDLALDAAFYARQLFEKDDAILLMVDFLDAQLHAEAIFEADCLAKPDYPPIPDDPQYDELRKRREEIQRMLARHPDRPEHKPMPKTKRVMNKPELNNLAKFYIERFEKFDTMMGDVKVAILRAIANLSGPCPESQAAVNEDGRWGVISVLQCTARRIELLQDHKLTTQWALIAVRNLVSSCRKNQEIVLNLHEKSSRIIDQAKLLDGLGIQVKRDAETGEMQIVSREMPPGDVPTPNKSDVQPQNPQIPE